MTSTIIPTLKYDDAAAAIAWLGKALGFTPHLAEAGHFAAEWITAWNAHDLERILAHYSEDFVMSSPRIADLAGEASGVLQGKAAVGAYWRRALDLLPERHFELLAVLVGADSVALHYLGVRGPAVEVFFFGDDGLVRRAAAHYA